MRRGTTPTLTFTLPYEIAISTLYITFVQRDKTVLEKTENDATIDKNKITLNLTQDETLLFQSSPTAMTLSDLPQPVYIQLRIRDADGNSFASQIIQTSVDAILKDGVI